MGQSPRPSAEEEAALREECLDHIDALYGAALRMTRNQQEAEDLVQDTYLKAVRNLHRYRDDGSCRAWLFRILTNTFIDRYRKNQRGPRAVEFEDDGATGMYDQVEPAEPSAQPIDQLVDRPLKEFLSKFMVDEVKNAVDDLPDIFREAIVLRDIQGFSYQEIADDLEIPIGTVMSRLYRGRRLLQEALWEFAIAHGYVKSEEKPN